MFQEAYQLYVSRTTVKYMVTKVTRDRRNFREYQHNKDLVRFINWYVCTASYSYRFIYYRILLLDLCLFDSLASSCVHDRKFFRNSSRKRVFVRN